MHCVLFWKVSLVETTLLTSKQPDIVSRGFICTYLRCMKYFFSWCMKYFSLVLREIQRRLEGSWEVPHSRPSHLCSLLSVVACLLALIWSTMGNHTSLQAPSWKAGKLFSKINKTRPSTLCLTHHMSRKKKKLFKDTRKDTMNCQQQ